MTESPGVSLSPGESAADPDGPATCPGSRGDVATTNWAQLVSRIRRNDEAAMTELYHVFSRGVRFYLCRQLGPHELEDRVHDTFLIVVQAIQRGDLREPERLMGFIRTIVRRQVSAYIEQAVHRRREVVELDPGILLADRNDSPEKSAMEKQRAELVISILNRLSRRDREILTRFYLHEQTQEQICQEMSLTETQFRLLKSRAKARFGDLGKKRVQRPFPSIFVRTSASAAH